MKVTFTARDWWVFRPTAKACAMINADYAPFGVDAKPGELAQFPIDWCVGWIRRGLELEDFGPEIGVTDGSRLATEELISTGTGG